jgi:4-amino-4-deoxy-L-arabinose transferase-like glycosyltransferase
MAGPTMIAGVLLILIGFQSFFSGTPNPDTGKVSPTALIPAAIGGLLGVLGALALIGPGVRKHAMHLAAMVGLFGVFGGFMPLIRQASKGNPLDPTAPAALAGLMMSLICAAFVALCVKSFIDARKDREAAAAAPPV